MKCGFFETFLYVEQQFIPKKLISSQDSEAQFWQFWRFGRAWLGEPSEDHEAMNFLGINCCSTYKKVSKNPHFISMYFQAFNISLFEMGELQLDTTL